MEEVTNIRPFDAFRDATQGNPTINSPIIGADMFPPW
jgi:hypothetical protein